MVSGGWCAGTRRRRTKIGPTAEDSVWRESARGVQLRKGWVELWIDGRSVDGAEFEGGRDTRWWTMESRGSL